MSNHESPYAYLKTRDGLSLRYGHWPCPDPAPQGTVLILQGRSEYLEKYEETVSVLHELRLDAFSFDWRGQGLSDRMLTDREKGFVHSYDDYLEDLDLVLNTVVRPGMRGKLYLLGHSMGGHIGLRYLLREDQPVSGAVFCAPLIDIVTWPIPSFIARWLSRRQTSAGNVDRTVVGAARRTPFPDRFRNNLWTTDRKRFERNHKRITQQPELSAALVTYGWLAATYVSIDALWKTVRKRPLKTPTLIAAAGNDRVVSNRAIREFVIDAGNCRMIKIENARHEILQEAYRQRGAFWQAFDEFMNR